MTKAKVFRADLYGLREGKYQALWESDVSTTEWEEVAPQTPFYLFAKRDEDTAAEYEKGWKVSDVFPVNSVGVVTARDSFAISFEENELIGRLKVFTDLDISDEAVSSRYNLKNNSQFKLSEARKALSATNFKMTSEIFAIAPLIEGVWSTETR